jgi:hypothetical protein
VRVLYTVLCEADEEQVNTLTENDPAAPRLLSLTLRRLSHCVVAVLDRCAESMEVTLTITERITDDVLLRTYIVTYYSQG